MILDDNIDEIAQHSQESWGVVKSNKIITSALKKSISYIRKTIDCDKLIKGNYSYTNLVNICANNIIRYPVIGSILELYGERNEESEKFINNVQFNINKIKEIKSIVKSGVLPYINTTSSECINLLYDLIKDDKTYSTPSQEIFNILYTIYKPQESYVHLKLLIAYMCYFLSLKNKPLAEKLQSIHDKYMEQASETSDVVFSRESMWKKNLVQYIRQINSDRLEKTSAYPEETLRKILSSNVFLLRKLEKYIEIHFKNVPTSIDSLQWFFTTTNILSIKNSIIYIANNYINPENERIKSKHTTHHAKDFVKTSIVFFRDRIPNYLQCKKDLYTLNTTELLGKIMDQREIPSESIRRHFYAGEIEQIMKDVKNDTRSTLIFTILKEVGLRIGAVCTLLTKHFINHKGEYLDNCRKLEKGKKYRTFPISDNLKKKVKDYLQENIDIKNNLDSYLFPSQNNKHIHPDTIRNKLIRITQSLGIYGHHVHPHAFRHTIVNDLMAKGNKLENVSKYMGHSSISTTEQYYWTTELENIIPTMNIPWLKNSNNSTNFAYPEDIEEDDEEVGNNNLSTDLLVSVLGIYHSVLSDTQKQTIKQRIPNIEDIFNNLCDYSQTMSLTSKRSVDSCSDESLKDFI
jgi:integrase